MGVVRLSKHQGLGNDFLVLVDLEETVRLAPATVVALCDRHRGVGADGLIRVTAGVGGAAVGMDLHNADGSAAEVSGNGLRCLVQAARDAGIVREAAFVVATAAGARAVAVLDEPAPGHLVVRTEMGAATVGPEREVSALAMDGATESWCARPVEVGNPHLVLVAADGQNLDELDLERLGPVLSALRPGGQNVEWIRPRPQGGALDLRVWERGVGVTEACGTGSVASAAAALAWGLVSEVAIVHNPGGDLLVELHDGSTALSGPVAKVATVELDLSWFEPLGTAATPAPQSASPQPVASDDRAERP